MDTVAYRASAVSRRGGKTRVNNKNTWPQTHTDAHGHFLVKIVSMVEMVWNVKNIMFVSDLLFES